MQPGQKKNANKKKNKKQSGTKNTEEDNKFYIDPILVQNLTKLEIAIPTSGDQIDRVISDVSLKKTALLKKKEEAIEEVVKKSTEIPESKENEKEKEETEEKPVEKKQEKPKESQGIALTDDLFPSLG